MAKKSRTPPPPRKVQAPKRRVEARTPDERRKFYIVIGVAAAGLIALAVVLAVVLTAGGGGGGAGGGSGGGVAAAMRKAGCTFQETPATRAGLHIESVTAKVKYDTYPPVSGYHYGRPAIWGNYNQPVDPRLAVHNEEHGGLIVWYGPRVSPEQRQKISDFYDESPDAMLVTPLENSTPGITFPPHRPLGDRIALSAWVSGGKGDKNVISVCPRVSLDAFRKFRDAFRGLGPERIPVSSNKPGT